MVRVINTALSQKKAVRDPAFPNPGETRSFADKWIRGRNELQACILCAWIIFPSLVQADLNRKEREVQPPYSKIQLYANVTLGAPGPCMGEAPFPDMTTGLPAALRLLPAELHLQAFPCWKSPDPPISTREPLFPPMATITL